MFGCVPGSIISVFLTYYLSADLGTSVPRATGHGHDDCVWHWLPERADIWRMDRAKAVQQGVKDPRLQCLLIGATTILALVPILVIIDRKCRPASLHSVAFNLEDV